MAVIAALLFVVLVVLSLAVIWLCYYYARVDRSRVEASSASTLTDVANETDTLAPFVEQLHELARLRDQQF